MNRILSILLVVCLLISLLCGCTTPQGDYTPTGDALEDPAGNSAAPPAPQDQYLSLAYYPNRSLNPYTCTDYTNRTLFPLLYQGLFSYDRNYQVVPVLCDRFSVSADMMTYTFYPAAAIFSDGTPLTAADVAASLSAAQAGAYYSGRFQHILEITAQEDCVVITLDAPIENLPLLLDMPIVKASEADAPSPLGTGPYVMDEALGSKRLARNSQWWCSSDLTITAAYIPLIPGNSPAHIRDQFEFADLEMVCADPGSDTFADYRCDYELWDTESGIFLYLVCNEKSTVFSNDSVRKALTHAIDREYLSDNFYRGFAHSATLPASPLSPFYNEALASKYAYDSAKMTAAVEAAGLTGAAVTFLLNADDSLRLRAGRAIADMLTACGLNVTTMELNFVQFVEQLEKGEYDLYFGQTRLSPNMDLTAFFAEKGSLSYGGLADPNAYEMCLAALANTGNYYNLHKEVMDNGQLCPVLFRSYAVYTTRGVVTQLNPARDNIFYYSIGRTMADVKMDS